MKYKYAALALILLFAVYIAYSILKYGKDKIRFHSAVIDFITYVKQQITFFCTPTNKIIEDYTNPVLNDNGFFDDGGIENNRYLDPRGKKLLKDFFAKLGKSNAEDQIANCDYAIEGINSLLSEYKEDITKKYKAYSTMTLIMGFMLLILLI